MWLVPVNTVINLRIPKKEGNFLASWVTISFSRRIPLHGISYLNNNNNNNNNNNVSIIIITPWRQSPSWEANSYSASQETPLLLWNPKVHYRLHKSPPLVPVPSEINPDHTFPPYFPKIHSNIIPPSLPRSSRPTFYMLTWRVCEPGYKHLAERHFRRHWTTQPPLLPLVGC
jgi:hypothetical protein